MSKQLYEQNALIGSFLFMHFAHTAILTIYLINTNINGNHFEIIQHSSFACIFIWVRKLDFDSLTEKKN